MSATIRSAVAVASAMALLSGCGTTGDGVPIDGTPDSASDDTPDSTSAESLPPIEVSSVRDESGLLRPDIELVTESVADYDFDPVRTFDELALHSDAVVVAVATQRRQWIDFDLPFTEQTFEVAEVLSGETDETISVYLTGGVADRDGVTALVESVENPQFVEGEQYLLFLVRTLDADEGGVDEWWTYGPGIGRYRIEQGVVTHGYDADRLHEEAHGESRSSFDEGLQDLGIVGRTLSDLRDEITELNESS